jgi:ABC-2 type transport system ATP-binding protein
VSASSQDDETLTLQVPSDGSLDSLRGIIDKLDNAAVPVVRLSIHSPDLDDVFFAVTSGTGPVSPKPEKAAWP